MLNVTQIENNVNSSFTLKKEEKSIFEGPLLLQVFVNCQLFFST